MKLYFLVYIAFFIPPILGKNDATSNPKLMKSTETVANKVQNTRQNVTKTLITEGGTITQNKPSLKDLIAVHMEHGNHSHSTIVPRKEAKFNETDVYTPISNATTNNIDKIQNDSTSKNATETDSRVSQSDLKNRGIVKTPKPSVETKKPEKVNPTKPTILSFEGLANMDLKVRNVAESHKSLSSVNVASDSITKVHPASRHPGMIMPVVIAILVVPMFAVLGYMALRRGQEAWKNRHYKRMDFLIDGMYNE